MCYITKHPYETWKQAKLNVAVKKKMTQVFYLIFTINRLDNFAQTTYISRDSTHSILK